MEIKGLDYNTQREKLVMPEYGREIQKMVDLAVTLPTREERLSSAYAIVSLMEDKNPQVRDSTDYKQTLWDHLYLISRGRLDIDWPYDVSEAEKIHTKPEPMRHPKNDGTMPLRHYGRLMTSLFEQLKQMPEGPERDELARQTANQMKRDLLTWGHGSIDDEKVVSDIARFTDGKIQLDLSTFRFERTGKADGGEVGGKRKRKK
ncbi:MAG: DUF4290 domain-containing protein [Prevotella sp.]|nr:DUF4290 domain-containing protein [Prevotella sp.]